MLTGVIPMSAARKSTRWNPPVLPLIFFYQFLDLDLYSEESLNLSSDDLALDPLFDFDDMDQTNP